MREPDISFGLGDAWKVPIDRLQLWLDGHQDEIHPATKGHLFTDVWKDVWYVRKLDNTVDEDAPLQAWWAAVVLRDLRPAGRSIERFYAEAEWDVTVFHCDPKFGAPPVDGDGLFEWDQTVQPPILYQFHGLTDRQVLHMGADRRVTFAQLLVEMICQGATRRQDETWSHRLSQLVNGIRQDGFVEPTRRALAVGPRTGLLIELEDGSLVSQRDLAEVLQ